MLSSVLSLVVFTDNLVEESKGVVVFVSKAGSLEDNTDVDVGHFIISHVEKRGSEVWLVSTGSLALGGEFTKSLFGKLDQLLVVNITSTNDDDVGTDVVGLVEVNKVFLGDVGDVFSDTSDGLSENVVSVRSVVDGLPGGFELILLDLDVFTVDGFTFSFDLVLVIDGVAENITEDLNSLSNLILEDSEGILGGFSASSSSDLASDSSKVVF